MAIVYPVLEKAAKVAYHHFSHDITISLVFILVLLIAYVLQNWIKEQIYLPPGPYGYPFYGILPFVKKEFHLFLNDCVKNFGDAKGICSMKMGSQTVVVLSDSKLIRRAFDQGSFSARPKTQLSSLLNGYGIVNSEGELWRAHRFFLLRQKLGMKNWGTEEQHVERNVKREVKNLLRTFCDNSTKSFDPFDTIGLAVSNVICSMIMSRRFQSQDPQFKGFMKNFDEGFRLYAETGGADFIWFMKYLPGVRGTTKQLVNNRGIMLEFMHSVVQEHRDYILARRYDTAQDRGVPLEKVPMADIPPRDLIDSYLQVIDHPDFDVKTKEAMFQGKNVEIQLQQIILDLFSAGVETLKTSIYWSILLMIRNPHVMDKIREEMETVVGPSRLPDASDIDQLIYTKAALYEVMRRASVVPMGTTHATSNTVEFEGYRLPKNTHVIPLLHAVHMNPEHWDEPEEFRPERFLKDGETAFEKPEHFMPFGTGKRECLGDKLAERQFFLFFSSILHTMDISAEDPDNMPSLNSTTGVTVVPINYKINAVPRETARAHLEDLLEPIDFDSFYD